VRAPFRIRNDAAEPVELVEIPQGAFKSVVTAYYPAVVALGASARTRAQNAFAVASAIATALTAAGLFTGVTHGSDWVRGLGVSAIAAWIGTALIFMLAIGGRVRERFLVGAGQPGIADAALTPQNAAFVRAVIANAHEEADAVSRTIGKGWICACVASGLTVAALVGSAITSEKPADLHHVRAVLSAPKGVATAIAACPQLEADWPDKPAVQGTLDLGLLEKKYTKLMLDAGVCRAGRVAVLTLPSAELRGFSQLVTPKP
jgi:hypothetical protein